MNGYLKAIKGWQNDIHEIEMAGFRRQGSR